MKRLLKPRLLFWLLLPVLLWWAWRNLPLADVQDVLSEISLQKLALLAAFNGFAMLFFSSRLWFVLRVQGYRLPYFSILAYRTAAFGISYFSPGTQFGGEPLQVFMLEKQHGLPRPVALASVTLDKLFELLANFTFLAIGIALVLRGELVAGLAPFRAAAWAGGLLLLPAAYLGALWANQHPLTWLLSRMPGRLMTRASSHKALSLASSTEAQISSLFRQKPLAFLWVVVTCGVIWLLSLAEYWLALRLLGAQLTPMQTVFALTAARLAFLTPLPGGLGALEAGQVLAMQALGYSPAIGIGISLWIRVRDTLLGTSGLCLGAILYQRRSTSAAPAQAGD